MTRVKNSRLAACFGPSFHVLCFSCLVDPVWHCFVGEEEAGCFTFFVCAPVLSVCVCLLFHMVVLPLMINNNRSSVIFASCD